MAEAPARVLDALSPTDDEFALDWRARCRTNLALWDRARAVTAGTVIKLDKPVTFRVGTASRFLCLGDSGRRIRWQAILDDGRRAAVTLGADWAVRHRWQIEPTVDDTSAQSTSEPR